MALSSLNALTAFVAVGRKKSYAGAARELGVSTSALSQAVRLLEQRVGVTLLTRTSRSVALTDAGRRLLEEAGPAVDRALESLTAVTARPGEVVGRLRLTVPTAAVDLIMAKVLPRYVQLHPRVDVDISVDDRRVDTVAEGFDGGIRPIEAIDRDMVQVRLTPASQFVVVGAPSYFAQHGRPQKPMDLQHHACICIRFMGRDAPWAWELGRGRRNWRVPVRGPVTTNDFSLMRRLALDGVGLIYTLELQVLEYLDDGRLELVLENYAPPTPGLFLYFPTRAQVSPALKAFVDVARSVLGPLR